MMRRFEADGKATPEEFPKSDRVQMRAMAFGAMPMEGPWHEHSERN